MEQDEEAGPIVVAEDEERGEDQDADGPGMRQDDERHNDQDAIDPRQDIQHAKTITAKDITAKDINGSYSYPLVGPRPEEAPDSDYSTLVQSTGADGSLVHPLDVMDKPLYSQHLEDDEQDDERHDDQDAINPRQDIQHANNITAKTITTKDITTKDNNSKNGTKVPREGARYQGKRSQEEGKEDKAAYEEALSTLRGLLNKYAEGNSRYQSLHRMMKSRTYPITRKKGDEEVQDKTEDIAKDLAEDGENKDHTRVYAKTHTGTIAKDLAEEGENKDHTEMSIKTHTGKIAKDFAKMQTKTHTRKLTKDPAKKYDKTHTGNLAKDLSWVFVMTLAGELAKGLAKIRGQDTEDIGGSYSYLLVDPRPEEVLDTDGCTVVQSTGAERSMAPIHVVKINPPYPQHTTGGARQGKVHGDDLDLDKRQAKNYTRRCAKDHGKTLAKTHNGKLTKGLIHDDSQHGANEEAETGIGNNEDETGNDGATHNDPHHSTNAARSEGLDEEEQESQVVDSGEDIQAREELREVHPVANIPTKEEGDGDEQGTRAGGGGGGGDGGEGAPGRCN